MPRKSVSFESASTSVADEPWVDPDDAPELTDEWIDKLVKYGEIRHGDKVIRPGNPPLDDYKGAVTLRLDADVIEAYRALGDDWLIRINADLRKARKLNKA